MQKIFLAALLALALLPHANAGPTTTTFDANLHLTGDATHHGNSALVPDASFQYEINVTGTVSQSTVNGVDRNFDGSLTGWVNITYQDQNGNTIVVENEPVTLAVHGERSSFVAQGVDGLKFAAQITGDRAGDNLKALTLPAIFSTGVSQSDNGSKDYAMADHGSGQAQFKDTQHFALDVAGDLTLSPQ